MKKIRLAIVLAALALTALFTFFLIRLVVNVLSQEGTWGNAPKNAQEETWVSPDLPQIWTDAEYEALEDPDLPESTSAPDEEMALLPVEETPEELAKDDADA